MKKEKLTQTNPYIVTQKAYQSGNLGYSAIAGTQFYEIKEDDVRYERKYKTAQPEDYDTLISKKAKTIKKIEYSGGYRVPQESLNKPYLKNKCWKSNDEEDDIEKYSKENIMRKLGLNIHIQDNIVSQKNKKSQSKQKSSSRSPGSKNKTKNNAFNQNSQLLISQAEQKIESLHQRREEINQRRIREEEMKKKAQKLIIQDEETHQEIYVTVDNHKIKMIQAFVKQLELQEQLENLERLKQEKFYTQPNAKLKKTLAYENKMKKNLTQKEMEKELAYIELLKNHELYRVEREKIGQIAQVYFSLEKKDFDLNEFLSPNTERWGKQNAVSLSKNEINPFSHLLFSRDAFILLVDRIVTELIEVEKRSQMFNSLNQSKDKQIEKVSSEIIEQFFLLRSIVSEIIGLQEDQIEKVFKLNQEHISVKDIKNKINKRNQIISALEKQFQEKKSIIIKEFQKQERIKQLEFELEQVRKENEEQGFDNLRNDEIERILDDEEKGIGGGYDSDPEALTLQQKTILITKQKRQLQSEILEIRKIRCKSADKARLTVPEPFKIEEREKISKTKKSIRQTKLEEMIYEKQQYEINESSYVFKPKEIPEHVKILDLFDQIMEENEKRRQIVRDTSVQMTLKNEKPFSFYYRDKGKNKIYKKPYWERQKYVFRANAIPKHVTMILLNQIKKEQDRIRKERVERRKEELEKISSLPPRMAQHEKEKREQLLKGAEYDQEGNVIKIIPPDQKYFTHTFQPPRAKKVPNFDKLHKTQQIELDAKKAKFQNTIIEPFDFQESRKLPNREYLDQENILIKKTLDKFYEDKSIQIKKITEIQPDILPMSTKKSQEIITFRKNQDEIKLKIEKEKQDQLNAREKKRDELKKRFYASNALKDFNEVREQQKIEQNEQISKEREYQKSVNKEFHEKIKQNLDQKPLLIEKQKIQIQIDDKDPSIIEKAKEKWKFNSSQNSKQTNRI